MKTFNLAITSNIINETLTKNKAKPECSKNCSNSIFGKKKYNYSDDNKKPTLTLPPTSPTASNRQCGCLAFESLENKMQTLSKTNRRNSPTKTPTKIGKDKKSITTENIVGLAMTKCSIETLENSISLKSDIDTNAQESSQSPTTTKPDKSITKGNHLMKKTLVVEKLRSTNSVITRKLFSTRRAVTSNSNSTDKTKETQKIPDSTDLEDDYDTNTNITTTTATKKDKVKEESQSMITSLLRTTTL